MSIALAIVASLLAIIGLLSLSKATSGVGLIAFACFVAILSRLAQAQAQHARAFPPEPAPEWKPSPPARPFTILEKIVAFGLIALVIGAMAFKMYWDSI